MSNRPVARQAMFNSFAMPDERSFGVFKAYNEVYPAFAKKLFEQNELMKRVVLSNYNPMDILDYPICGKCETIAAPSGYAIRYGKRVDKCTCVRKGCGHTTVNPVTLRAWMRDELKRKVPPDFMDAIEYVVDGIAAKMMAMYIRNMRLSIEQYNKEILPKITGNRPQENVKDVIIGEPKQKKAKVQHLGHTKDPKLPQDRIEIPEDIDDEK